MSSIESTIEQYHSGFEAVGKPVPENRQIAAIVFISTIITHPYFDVKRFVLDVINYLEKDSPKDALALASKHLDCTGAYRLLATLLTDVA